MKTRTLSHLTAFALGTLLLAGTHDASAQVWQGVLTFQGGCSTEGDDSIRVFAQTFTAPATNPQLRQLWALAETQDGSGTDSANFHVVPWSDADSRPAGAPVFSSGAKTLPRGLGRQTLTILLPSPVTLTPGGRYAILMHLSTAPGGTLAASSVGCDAANPFPAGSAYTLKNVPPSGWATFPWGVVGTPDTDVALQPAFTQPGPSKTVLLFGAKDGTGTPVNGSPGTTFVSFGIPSHNSAGVHAFAAKVRMADGQVKQALCRGVDPGIVAIQDNQVPGRPGVFFAGFKDPLLAEDGRILVLASLEGAGITSKNNKGIYTANIGQNLARQLHEGDEPPGVPGARIKAFRSIAASNAGVGALFQMVSGPGGVTTATDTAFTATDDLWQFTSGPIVREGVDFAVSGRPFGSFPDNLCALTARPGAAGHGHGIADVNEEGQVFAATAVHLEFTDGSTGNFSIVDSSAGPVSRAAAVTGGKINVYNSFTEVSGLELEVAALGLPGQSSGGATAFVAKFKTGTGGVTPTNDIGIVIHEMGHGVVGPGAPDGFVSLVRKGTVPASGGGAVFSSFMSPVIRHLGDTGTHEVGHWAGFRATLAGPGVSVANDLVVSRMVGNRFAVLAREGREAPGVPGSQFRSFTSLGFMDYTDDSCMNALMVVGKLRTGMGGAPGPGGVTAAVDDGLWLFDHNGDGHLAFREGEVHIIGAVPKTVKKFIVLSDVSGSPSQTRSHNAAGQIILRAIFTDGSCALVRIAQ